MFALVPADHGMDYTKEGSPWKCGQPPASKAFLAWGEASFTEHHNIEFHRLNGKVVVRMEGDVCTVTCAYGQATFKGYPPTHRIAFGFFGSEKYVE